MPVHVKKASTKTIQEEGGSSLKKKKKKKRESFSNLGGTNILKKADTTPVVRMFQQVEDRDQIQTQMFLTDSIQVASPHVEHENKLISVFLNIRIFHISIVKTWRNIKCIA